VVFYRDIDDSPFQQIDILNFEVFKDSDQLVRVALGVFQIE